MTLYAFLGIESATIPAENVQNPKKTIARATMIGTIVTTIIYILGTVAVMGMIPMLHWRNHLLPLQMLWAL